MTTGDSTSAATGKVLELDGPATAPDLDVAACVLSGVQAFRLHGLVRLSADEPQTTLAIVRLLRDAASYGVPVAWHGLVEHGVDPRLLVHLSPPGPVPGEETSVNMAEWRHFSQPGLCYYRVGPGFVFIKDVRWQSENAARFRLELDGVEEMFTTLETVVEVARLDAATAKVLDDLSTEHLALRLGDWATLLPYRMRRWPVPALEV